MNDRFKFRIWNKSFRKMLYNNLILCYKNKITAYDYLDNARKEFLPESHIIIEQCTGLKDTNGRLIYEGDIVESTIATRSNKPARDVIKYCNEFAGFEPMCLYDCDCGIYNPSDELVIVGNIHENPELLEDK